VHPKGAGLFCRMPNDGRSPCNLNRKMHVPKIDLLSLDAFPIAQMPNTLDFLSLCTMSLSAFRRNLVFLQVAFQRYVYLLQKEEPSYRMGSLFGDLGGNMGLFLGCSLLTLFEFVDLFWNLLQSRANKIKIKSRETENPGIA